MASLIIHNSKVIVSWASSVVNVSKAAKIGTMWTRTYTRDPEWGNQLEFWAKSTKSIFSATDTFKKGFNLLSGGFSGMSLAHFGVASIDAVREACRTEKDTSKLGIVISDVVMRHLSLCKYGTSLVLKSVVLVSGWEKQSKLRKIYSIMVISLCALKLIKAIFDYYRDETAPKPAMKDMKPGIKSMLLYNKPLKPVRKDAWIHKVFFIEYLSSDIIRRYLETINAVLGFLVYRESQLA